jgi:hypothetical protein
VALPEDDAAGVGTVSRPTSSADARTDGAPAPSAAVQPPLPEAASPSSADSALLPQTGDKPAASSPALDARVALLWGAIVKDDPDVALPSFFPLGAYQQVKDVADPASDWKRRLVGAFRRDIHALHATLGDSADRARFLSFDVPEARARWVEPGEEWNKIGYFRVFGSKLRYELDGTARAFEVKSLISWRGEWFVVHLAAIQ